MPLLFFVQTRKQESESQAEALKVDGGKGAVDNSIFVCKLAESYPNIKRNSNF